MISKWAPHWLTSLFAGRSVITPAGTAGGSPLKVPDRSIFDFGMFVIAVEMGGENPFQSFPALVVVS